MLGAPAGGCGGWGGGGGGEGEGGGGEAGVRGGRGLGWAVVKARATPGNPASII